MNKKILLFIFFLVVNIVFINYYCSSTLNQEERRNIETLEIGRNLGVRELTYDSTVLSMKLKLPDFVNDYRFENKVVEIELSIKKMDTQEVLYEDILFIHTVDTHNGIQMYEPQELVIHIDLDAYKDEQIGICFSDVNTTYDYYIYFLNLEE